LLTGLSFGLPVPYTSPAAQPRAPAPPVRPAAPDRIPVEYIGLARNLIRRITAAYQAAESRRGRLLRPFRPTANFRPVPRHIHLQTLSERLRHPRALCRLRGAAKFEAGHLRVMEIWAVPATLEHDDWHETEPALALMVRLIRIEPPNFVEKDERVVAVGIHALARRYQRGAEWADAAVLGDLLALVEAYPRAGPAPGEFAAPASGGRWRGAIAPGSSVMIVRTYVA
jgi:hypothetical protein